MKVPKAVMPEHTLISIVDDDELYRESVRKLVRLFGYVTETFPSSADFLASRHLSGTACLIVDVNMPGMTGVELHGHLIKLGHAIPMILVTAFPDEAVRNQALKDGVICYLSKPVDDVELESCLRTALKAAGPTKKNS